MLEEEKVVQEEQENNEQKEQELDEVIDASVAVVPLDEQQQEIIREIIKAPTQQELQAQFDLFNINQSKKNALRIIKLNNLLDKVEDQAIERFEKRPDQVSNKEILEYMQVVSTQIDRSQKFIDTLKDKPMIKVNNQQNNQVNINIGGELDRDSKERVIDAIQALLKQVTTNNASEDIIDAEVTSKPAEDVKNEENTVYNIDTQDDETSSDQGEN